MRIRKRRTKIRARFTRPVVRKLRALGRANRYWGWEEVDRFLDGASGGTKAARLDFVIHNPDEQSKGRIHNLSVDWQGTNYLTSGTSVEEPAVVGLGIFRVTRLVKSFVDTATARKNALSRALYFPGLFYPNRVQRSAGAWVTRREIYFPTAPRVYDASRPDPAMHIKLRLNNALILPGTLFGVCSWMVDDRGNTNQRIAYQSVCRMTTSNDQDDISSNTAPQFDSSAGDVSLTYSTSSKGSMIEVT